jgi:hypothetical protein
MRQNDVVIGGTYRAKVAGRIATVTVQRRQERRGERMRFVCLTHDTRREITATAARLRPAVDVPEAAGPNPLRDPRPFSGDPGARRVAAAPVPGVIVSVGSAPVLALSPRNGSYIDRAVDACHVAEHFRHVARHVRRRIGAAVIWETIPRALRRGILHRAALRHHDNRATYRFAMGHGPLPSERMVAEAVGIACGLGPMP